MDGEEERQDHIQLKLVRVCSIILQVRVSGPRVISILHKLLDSVVVDVMQMLALQIKQL